MKEVYRRKDELWINNQKINEYDYKVYKEKPKTDTKDYNTFEEMFADWTNLDYLGCYPDKTTFTHKPMLVIKSWHYLCTYLITKKNFKTARIITTYEPIRQSVKDLLDFLTVEQFAEYCRDRNIENIQIGG